MRDEIRANAGRVQRDDDRPLTTYSHAKRDYSQRRNHFASMCKIIDNFYVVMYVICTL